MACQVVDLQGVNRLVRLCKDETERNHSDGVLVACLVSATHLILNCAEVVVVVIGIRCGQDGFFLGTQWDRQFEIIKIFQDRQTDCEQQTTI